MRVVMVGYQTPGYRTLQALLGSAHQVVLVMTHPQSDHAYERIWNDSVAELAEQYGVPLLVRRRPDDAELLCRLRAAEPDIMVATNWRTWIPPEVFTLPAQGTLNVHDSLLPAYAGFAPLIWAVINGEQQVGVTAHMMDGELDAGDIVVQQAVPVEPTDTATDLFYRTLELYGPVVLSALDLIAAGGNRWTKQDRSKASFFHKRSPEDSRIDWTWPARDIANLVRAQSDPYPNAFTFHQGERLRILMASVSARRYGGTPGRLVIRDGAGVVVVAGADARRGQHPGLVIERVRTDDGAEHPAAGYFPRMGGYLSSHP
ncbi:MAG TPA: methionyl-tRNA formyltransferase [Pseudonocardiaceae bacterium]|jgi:methionyl-tRNA formyltransferase|nr:methionyl-tRNA formyltransferase [Pseudonocardiaceae bacterium]